MMGAAIPLPEGAHWDGDLLRGSDGEVLPDGLYVDAEGNHIMFEGNFESMFLSE